MNHVVVQGTVSSEVARLQLESGDVLLRFTVRAPGPDDRQQALPVVWVGPARRAPRAVEGEVVLLCGSLQRRFFRGARGVESRTEIRAEQVLRRPTGARRQRVLDAVVARLVG
jgi:hypothetical protein